MSTNNHETLPKFFLDILIKIPQIYLHWLRSLVKTLLNAVKKLFRSLLIVIKIIALIFCGIYFAGRNLVKFLFNIPKNLRNALGPVGRWEIRIPIFSYRTLLLSAILGVGLFAFYFYSTTIAHLPHPKQLTERPLRLSTRIYDRNHTHLFTIFSGENRILADLESLPNHLIRATLAIEDQNFYKHSGFSPRGIARALTVIAFEGRLEGGSTITQQLVKNALLSPEKTLRRKIRELVLSLQVEARYSKDEILEMYLNEVNYGGVNYGVAAAANYYFGKNPSQLNLAESALLAGLPSAPSKWSPTGVGLNVAKARQKEVLRRMVEEGFITQSAAEEAHQEELKIEGKISELKAPHFVMYVSKLLADKYGRDFLENGGLEVTTTLDLELQENIQNIVRQEVEKLQWANVSNGAALITNPGKGEILAMVGSVDYFDRANSGNVNVTTALRQPGSAIKPVLYSLALQKRVTPASIIKDEPVTYSFSGGPDYKPVNYDGYFHGPVTLRTALASSYNVPAVRTLNELGIENFVNHAQKMGIKSWNNLNSHGLSLALGSGEVQMTELAQAYGVLANEGKLTPLNPIIEIKNQKGEVLKISPQENATQGETPAKENLGGSEGSSEVEELAEAKQQTLPPEVAFQVTDILSDNTARAPAFGANSLLQIPGYKAAVKTGTSQKFRDNWAIGYTPDYLVAAWVGNNNGDPMGQVVSGVTGATPIWNRAMHLLLAGSTQNWYQKPKGLITQTVCRATGKPPCEPCNSYQEHFLPGTAPTQNCPDRAESD